MEIHQKKAGPDYHRLKTMVKRSIEQEIRNKNFGARSGNFEKNAVVKNQWTKLRGQRILGDCWQWETNGQCVKGRQLQCPPRYQQAWKSYTIKSVSEFFHGPMVKNHISLQTGVCPPVLISQLQGHFQDRGVIVLHPLQARLYHRR